MTRWWLWAAAASTSGCVAFNADCPASSDNPLAYLQLGLDLSPLAVRSGEAPMGNLVADAVYEHFHSYPEPAAQEVDLALIPAGIIHASRGCGSGEHLGPGPITSSELAAALPFDHDVVMVEVSGADLVAALAAGVAQLGDGGSLGLSESFPHVSHLRFTVDCNEPPASAAAPGSRVTAVWIRDENGETALDPDADYEVATVAGVLDGDFAYSHFTKEIPVGGRRRDFLVVQDYVTARSEAGGALTVGVENRIQLLECSP